MLMTDFFYVVLNNLELKQLTRKYFPAGNLANNYEMYVLCC